MPASRDGHSMIVVNDHIVVFGGDRHRMPFADTFIFDLRSQFNALSIEWDYFQLIYIW